MAGETQQRRALSGLFSHGLVVDVPRVCRLVGAILGVETAAAASACSHEAAAAAAAAA